MRRGQTKAALVRKIDAVSSKMGVTPMLVVRASVAVEWIRRPPKVRALRGDGLLRNHGYAHG
jgi:hypothetical protein